MCARTFQRRMHEYGEAAGLPSLYCLLHTLKRSVLTYLAEPMEVEHSGDDGAWAPWGHICIPKKRQWSTS
jgi:hypothetical protein